MLVCGVALTVFIVGLTNAQYYEDRYVIPEPKIEVFSPKGFRVSIEDTPGVRLFAFHGNINRELRDLEAGTFSRDILHKQNGRWTFEDRSTQLQIGDTINYWLFVIKDGLGYRLDDGVFKIRELITTTTTGRPYQTSTTRRYPLTTLPPKVQEEEQESEESGPPITSPPISPSGNGVPSHLGVCEQSILNITQSLITLQTEISNLIITNQKLTSLLQSFPDARKLTFSGRIPPDGQADMIVRFLFREKLDINPNISDARRTSDGSITFEVATVSEKLEILEVAKEKLKHSQIILR